MPDHFHVSVWNTGLNPKELRRRMRRCLAALGRRFPGLAGQWAIVPPPKPIADLKHWKRDLRYVHLNPCREAYTRDPASWEWSTHRDYLGAVADPWPQVEANLAKMGFRADEAGRSAFHRFVSADDSVHPAGSIPPRSEIHELPIDLKLSEIEKAAEAAWRVSTGAFRRKSVARAKLLRVLGRLGQSYTRIARHFGVTRKAVPAATAPSISVIRQDPWARSLLVTLSDRRFMERIGGNSLKR